MFAFCPYPSVTTHTYACHYPHIRVFSWSHMCSKKIVLFAMNLASSFEDKLKHLERCWHRSIYPVLVSRRRVVHKSKEKLWQTREVSCRRVTACYSMLQYVPFSKQGLASPYDARLSIRHTPLYQSLPPYRLFYRLCSSRSLPKRRLTKGSAQEMGPSL